MMRLALFVLISILAPAGHAADATWQAETLSSSPRGIHVTQYWAKGNDRLRAETVMAGQRLVTIVNGARYYAVNANSGRAISLPRNPRAFEAAKKLPRLVGIEGFLLKQRGGEKVKSERLAGRMCDVYRLTDELGRREVWIQQDDTGEMLPMRVEFYNRQAAAEIRTDYTQWASGLELPERLFAPDPRFEVVEMTYDEYVRRVAEGEQFPPVLHANLLHGDR